MRPATKKPSCICGKPAASNSPPGEIIFRDTASHLFGSFVIGPGITVRGGAGSLSSGAVTNLGAILAESSGKTLTLQGSPFVNRGVVEVRNGATVSLAGNWSNAGIFRVHESTLSLGGVFTNAGIGTIERTGGTIRLLGLLDNSGVTLTLNAQTGSWLQESGTIRGGSVATQNGATLIPNSGVWDTMTIAGEITIPDRRSLAVVNGLTVHGALRFGSAGSAAVLVFSRGTLGGAGRVIFGPAGQNSITSPAALTLGSSLTVLGGLGTISSSAALTSSATLIANGPGSRITLRGGPLSNTGAIEELNGGTVILAP